MSTMPPLEDLLFHPTPEHAMLRQMVRDFVRTEVEPQAAAHDESGTLNSALGAAGGGSSLAGRPALCRSSWIMSMMVMMCF